MWSRRSESSADDCAQSGAGISSEEVWIVSACLSVSTVPALLPILSHSLKTQQKHHTRNRITTFIQLHMVRNQRTNLGTRSGKMRRWPSTNFTTLQTTRSGQIPASTSKTRKRTQKQTTPFYTSIELNTNTDDIQSRALRHKTPCMCDVMRCSWPGSRENETARTFRRLVGWRDELTKEQTRPMTCRNCVREHWTSSEADDSEAAWLMEACLVQRNERWKDAFQQNMVLQMPQQGVVRVKREK